MLPSMHIFYSAYLDSGSLRNVVWKGKRGFLGKMPVSSLRVSRTSGMVNVVVSVVVIVVNVAASVLVGVVNVAVTAAVVRVKMALVVIVLP